MAIQHQIKSKYSTSENYNWQGKFFNARLFFVVLGVQNWVPIEHGHIYRIINTSDNTTQRNMKSTHRTSVEKIIWTQVCLFCCLFCCCFLDLFFFGGGAVGWGWVRFLGWGGGCWNTVQRDVNAIHRTSECYSWQRKFDRRWFVCFVLIVCFVFLCFLFYFYYFFGGGGWFSLFGGGGRGIDYPNYAPRTVSQKILGQFHFWFVLLYVVV